MIAVKCGDTSSKPLTAIVYLVRHGRTALNAAGVLRGRIDEPLDEVGLMEAQRLAFLFAKTPLELVVSSPLSRAVETATVIARPHGLTVTTDDGWIDRNYGSWSGQPAEKAEQTYGGLDNAPEDEVESTQAMLLRSLSALRRLLARSRSGRVLIVAHDAVNRALIRHFAARDGDGDEPILQSTGCWNRLSFAGDLCICDLVGAKPGDGHQP